MRKTDGSRSTFTAAILVLVLLAAALWPAASGAAGRGPGGIPFDAGADGYPVEFLVTYDGGAGELPEGIAVDKVGNIFVGLDPLGQIWRYAPDGSGSLFFQFATAGPLGMAVDAPGNLYVAVVSEDAATHGVWRINRDGEGERLAGTENIVFPNSLAFDKRGNLYVTDTILGAVWRIPKRGELELWLQHPELEGLNLPELPYDFPLGANGIAYRQGYLYVANTEKAQVVRIPILKGGLPGEPKVVAGGPELFVLDGLALDVHGQIYALVIAQSKLVRIDPADGAVTTLATADDGLDFPASLAFGTGKGERQSLFVTNYAIGPPGGAGPGLLKVGVGVPGQPLP